MKIYLFLISLSLNGYHYRIFMTKPSEISQLLEYLKYQKELIIVEHNGKIQNNLNIKYQYLRQNDKIEIITIVGGG
uniref:hypothetical protein n=1 Tax=Halosiphon tomentosus TaxID=64927 RepID=UPI002E7634BE|nr:hypothetical protein V2488_pgp008 [Halosiphon tomentosus]WAM63813.1 hypothetical protein [Halosiphon tomentosus]